MFRKPTNREGLLSDADHYAEAARCQRRRASEAKTPGLRGECIARAILFEDKARQRRQEAQGIRR
jgi:hypothetical protein